ncbi:phospholipase B1, membrane-associated-like isoform X1 [Synchiropus splendidus]|uniref:phospholipase B1, membrane-associated-like isoform X1 n=1 Tax=Synchiropus splendidus TaxID=270530 RepID=UPI00237D885B|nr:phospholipase B1, membrane-associated-like isoform X1 [Synchiropus splendidus]XP_053736437.1 phospholipase B1, membrane-associated-like isoform X1 [Synchiropus splendidus]XP_053736438.1 phospholipase B1, membrane-associated-like isoform X1 [Synchiropus splendidus]
MTTMLPRLLVFSLLGVTWTSAAELPCSKMSPSQPKPTNVNHLRPADVSVFSTVNLQSEMSTVVSTLLELMALSNPALTSALDESHLPSSLHQPRLLERAEQAAASLQSYQDVWKLLLLFVPVDQLCVCEQRQAQSVIQSVASEVDHVLKLLQSQLKQTIVSVALWDGAGDTSRSCACVASQQEGEVRLHRALLTQALQESLEQLLVRNRWYGGDREDFAVVLQDWPFTLNLSPAGSKTASDPREETERLTVQLWTNLLQPTTGSDLTDENGHLIKLPCPTEERPFLRTEGNSPSHHGGQSSPPVPHATGTEMPCEDFDPSPSSPTSVHELRPADIKVIGAVGDSLTAGNGIASSPNNILDVLTQYRGLSWSVGGDDNLTTVTTLPNILKYYNAKLTGYSVDTGEQTSPQAFLNQAVAGAKSKDVPPQVRALVARMKNDTRIDFESDWKLITFFIGGNDICDHCYNSLQFSVENYVRHVRDSLDYLHREVPRALVNLVEPLHILPLREMHVNASVKCPTWLVNILCPCVILPKPDSVSLQKVEEINRDYQRFLNDLVESGRYDTRPDFTVVIQPLLRDVVLPKLPNGSPDRSFLSADCFHLSQKAQTLMARSLWNNMLEPLGNKTAKQEFSTDLGLKCPTKASPYIRTFRNSNYTYAAPKPTPGPVPNWGSDFSCVDLAPSASVPSSVHRLRPADIKVVAAVGDSTTVATGAKAKTLFDLNKEYRGVSWSIGGDKTIDAVTTLPNILRKFNPSLKGFSKGQGSRQKGFNMAVSGAMTSSIPAQIQELIKVMKEDKAVNFEQDWKLLTVFVGGNDLCSYCLDQSNLSPTNYSHHLMLGLDLLYQEVPRMLVNVVEVLQIETLKRVKKKTLGCLLLQRTSCPCVINPSENSPEMEAIKRVNNLYQNELQNLISGDRYEGRADFAVVLQPFLHSYFIPHVGEGEADTTFYSLDCFHISERAHAEMAIGLWNNMLEPVGRKKTYNDFTHDRSKLRCPSQVNPFIFTKSNSRPTPPVTSTTSAPHFTSSAAAPPCSTPLPVWVPVVVGVVSLIVGVVMTLSAVSCLHSRKSKKDSSFQLNGTSF